jgi:ABC-type oligopeptide transport system substrate-binding subunit
MSDQPFVGRQDQLARLQAFLDRAIAGHGQLCFIAGEAGSGKTALANEFAQRAQETHADLLVAAGVCNAQTGICDPYLPFRDILGMLTGDVEPGETTQENASRLKAFLKVSGKALVDIGPDLVGVFVPGVGIAMKVGAFVAERAGWIDRLEKLAEREVPAPGEIEQGRVFQQITDVLQAMAQQQPLILILDDLQWADAASISLLFHLSRHVGESHILIVGTYRPDEVALGRGSDRHPLEKILAESKRYLGDVTVDLDRVEERSKRQFVDALLDTEPHHLDEPFRQALFEHTRGYPLFTVELLQDMRERGDLLRDEEGFWVAQADLDWQTLPPRVEGVIEERIRRLEEELRDILTVASVQGIDFIAQVIARVEELRERDLLRRLSRELEQRHRLVEESGQEEVGLHFLARYRFAHALVRKFLYEELSLSERQLLHREIAGVLEDLYSENKEEVVVQLAWHYAEAGRKEEAIYYLLLAGDRARNLYAYEEAIDSYERALTFLREQQDYERTARTLMKMGLTYHIAFDYDRARQAYQEGFALWQRLSALRPAAAPPAAPHPLRVDWPYPPVTIDPALAADGDSIGVVDQLFSGLVELSPGMDVVPDVARSWEVLDGGRRYVFHLRDDLCWSDGTPVTAHDFAAAWERVLNPATQSPVANVLFNVKGARAYHGSETADPAVLGITVADDTTLVVELESPTSYFLHLLTYNASYAVPRHTVANHGAAWTEPDHLVTNGPFHLESQEQNDLWILSRNPDYHGRAAGNVNQVQLHILPDGDTRLQAYEAGDVDVLFLWGLGENRERVRQRHPAAYLSAPLLATTYVAFDVTRPPFDDPRVRQAFAHAIDKELFADLEMQGYVFPAAGGLVPPGMPGHEPTRGLPYDPDRAQVLLAEAGFPRGEGFPPVTFLTEQSNEPPGKYLETQWQRTLGVPVTWAGVEWEAFVERLENRPPHIFLDMWMADYPDPDSFLRVCDAVRWSRWKNASFEGLVTLAREATDQGRRMEMYGQAERILIDGAAVVPFVYGRSHLLVKPCIASYPVSAIKWWYWKDVVIEPPS